MQVGERVGVAVGEGVEVRVRLVGGVVAAGAVVMVLVLTREVLAF